jgi:hypothetical protein
MEVYINAQKYKLHLLKITFLAKYQWLMLVILATWRLRWGGCGSRPAQESCRNPCQPFDQ